MRPSLFLVVSLLALSACGHVAVTADRGRWSTRPEAAPIYDDTLRTIHAGAELDVRLATALNSEVVTTNRLFHATTAADLRNGARVVVPAGSAIIGVVRDVHKLVGFDDVGGLTLGFVELVANGNSVPIDARVTEVFGSGPVGSDEGDSAAVSAALTGGVRGGLRENPLIRVKAADGAIVSTDHGAAVLLPVGTIIRMRLTSAVTIP